MFLILCFVLFVSITISRQQSVDVVCREELETLKSKFQTLETKLTEKQDRTPLIGFRAGFVHDPVPIKYSDGQVVIFDDVYLNDGNAYTAHSGMFRAPISGLYIFTLHIFEAFSEMEFRIMKDGKSLAWLVSTLSGGTQSIQTVVHLQKNQEVWVIKFHGGQTLRGNQLSTFSGFLLRRDDGASHVSELVG